ncbi:hypothetical protein [Clostridioides sp. ZZV14-6045]|uniref:hypothetical protein n=1 Tax=Clostridioides sp. ZZV14-6045 TaxID=2811489 RepID=UPI001D10C3DF
MRKIDLDNIKIYPWDLKNVKTQTYEMCIEALRRDGLSLKNIRWNELSLSEKQIFNLYIIAVRQNGLALEFIENQIDEICIEALKQNELAIRYVKDKEKYLKEFGIKYLEKQGNAREVFAVKRCNIWLFTIGCQRNITKEEFIMKMVDLT